MNTPLKHLGKISFKHYDCIIAASLLTDNQENPELLVVKPNEFQEELGHEIVFRKINHEWLIEYSIPVLHSETYKTLVETVLEYLEKK